MPAALKRYWKKHRRGKKGKKRSKKGKRHPRRHGGGHRSNSVLYRLTLRNIKRRYHTEGKPATVAEQRLARVVMARQKRLAEEEVTRGKLGNFFAGIGGAGHIAHKLA
jgi:hypothetical protein